MSHRSRLGKALAAKAPEGRQAVTASIFEAFVRNSNELSTRARFARGMELNGSGLNGDRDYLAELRYPRVQTVDTYREWWENDGLANRVNGVYADECWATDPEVYDTEDDRTTGWQRKWDAFERALDPFGACATLDEVCGVGGYGVMLVGLADGRGMEQPAAGLDRNGDLTPDRPEVECLYLTPLDQTQARIAEYETQGKRAGLPSYYDLRLFDPQTPETMTVGPSAASPARTVRTHWTRVVHVPNDLRTTNRLAGIPRLKAVFHRLFDVRWKLAGGSAEMYWQGALPGYAFEENESELDTVPINKASLDQEFDLFLNRLQRYLAVQGGKVKSLAPQVSDPGPHMLQQLLLIAAAIKCPLRTLLGSEEGKAASEQDTTRWNKRVMGRCNRFCDRVVLRPLVHRLMALGCLPWKDKVYTAWKDVQITSDKDLSEVAMKHTQSLLQYVTSGAFLMVPPKEYMTLVLRWSAATADAVIKKAGGEVAMIAALKKALKSANPQNAQTKGGKGNNPTRKTGAGGRRNGL